MATVLEASGGTNSPKGVLGAENKLSTVTTFNAGDPTGSVTPNFVGELLMDTTNERIFRATTSANTGWVLEKG